MELVQEKYKQTEVGLIPEDWEVKKLGDCLLKNPDYGINAAAVPYSDVLPVYIRITDITEDGKFSKNSLASVKSNFAESFYLEKGNLVFARTGASVGKTYLYNSDDGKLVFAGFLIRVKIDTDILIPEYLQFYTQAKPYWDWVRVTSMRSGQPGINGNEFKELDIPLPPTIEEQTTIATALSDADGLISSIEQLLTKKRNIKQGAMQQLLKPKEGWKVKKLGEIGEFKNGINKGEEDFGFGFPFVNLMDVFGRNKLINGSSLGLVNSSVSERKAYELKRGDVLFIRSSVKPEGVGLTSVVNDDLKDTVYSGFLIRFRDFGKLHFEYKVHCFNEEGFRRKVIDSSTVSANTNINQNALKNLKIEIPPTINEQIVIAQILSDMDAEITALETKLEKYKRIKQGMMQQLLTGKIRLV